MINSCRYNAGRECKRSRYRLPRIETREVDHSHRALIERVVAGEVAAWQEFVERINRYLRSLLSRYTCGDEDRRSDLFVYVLEQLQRSGENGLGYCRLRQYLEGLSRYEQPPKFTTWFTAVVNNLVSDYFREKNGRRTIPTRIRRMSLTCQEIFKLLYWKYLSEEETFESTCNREALSREEFDTLVERINRRLSVGNRWSICSDLTRRQGPVSADGNGTAVRLRDPSPRANPLAASIQRAHRKRAMSMRRALHQALLELPTRSLMLLTCRYKYNLTALEISRVFGTRDMKRVYSLLNSVYRQLREVLLARGFRWEDIEHGLLSLDGFLDELHGFDNHVISARFECADHPAEMTGSAEPLLA